MAKRQGENNGDTTMDRAVRALERLGMVIGAVAANQFGDADLPAKAKRLQRMGFSNVEIASMLSSTANSVAVALHRGRARGGHHKIASRKRR
jgi:hypothetical protein